MVLIGSNREGESREQRKAKSTNGAVMPTTIVTRSIRIHLLGSIWKFEIPVGVEHRRPDSQQRSILPIMGEGAVFLRKTLFRI